MTLFLIIYGFGFFMAGVFVTIVVQEALKAEDRDDAEDY